MKRPARTTQPRKIPGELLFSIYRHHASWRAVVLNRCAISVVFFVVGCASPGDDGVAPDTSAATASLSQEVGGSSATSAKVVAQTPSAPVDPGTDSLTASEDREPDDLCPSSPVEHGYSSLEIVSGGNTYSFELYRPSSHIAGSAPLVTNWHGLGSNGSQQMSFSGYAELAEEKGFVVVAPTGIGKLWELPLIDQKGRDDVQMAAELIDLVATKVCVDLERVYATGMSNGGYFSSVLACRLSDRIAATFSVAAVIFPDDCQPRRPVAVGAIHGTDDVVVPFYGGGESVLGRMPLFELVMPDEMKKFAVEFECATTNREAVGQQTQLTVYSSCKDGVEVQFWAVQGGGHTWPGSPVAKALEDRMGFATEDFDATRDGYEFMSRYSLSK